VIQIFTNQLGGAPAKKTGTQRGCVERPAEKGFLCTRVYLMTNYPTTARGHPNRPHDLILRGGDAMNRHERRRAQATERRTGYLHRLLAAYANGSIPAVPGLFIATMEHDAWCAVYQGGECNWVPHISMTGPDDAVVVIDENGEGTKVRRS
jgi:hypothetical protein